MITEFDLFIRKVDNWSDIKKCWNWVGAKANGYGQFCQPGNRRIRWVAHRWFYMYIHGPISDELECDHLCRNRACVNPTHIELVSHSMNIFRGKRKSLRTHCKKGHEYTPENTYIYINYNGYQVRYCKICVLNRNKKLKGRKA